MLQKYVTVELPKLPERFRKRAEARGKERRDTWAALEYAKDEGRDEVRSELDKVIEEKDQMIGKKDQVIEAKDQVITEKDQENQVIRREIEELRRKLREAGID